MKSLIDSRQPSTTSVLGTCQSMASCEEEDGCNEMRNGYDNLRREDELKQLELFTAKENQRVRFFRIVVVLSILIVGAVISSLTYHTLQREVESDRKDTFEQVANTVKENFRFRIQGIFAASRSLGRAITTIASTSNEDFPYVTIPAFELHAYEARQLAGFEAVSYAPIDVSVDDWVEFSNRTRGWLDESKAIYDKLEPGSNRSLEPPTPPLEDCVWQSDNMGGMFKKIDKGMFYPTLHTSPPPQVGAKYYQNVDLSSIDDFRLASLAAVRLKDLVFTGIQKKNVGYVTHLIGQENHAKLHENDESLEDWPHSLAVQPVYKDLGQNADVVGYLLGVISWENYVRNLLPDTVVGIHTVLQNSCNQSVTFELIGGHVKFAGEGDLHDDLYSSEALSFHFKENYFDPELTTHVDGQCRFCLYIYPSPAFDAKYSSNLPTVFAILVAGIFVLVSALFFAYDRQVRFRNQKVVGAAARSNALVSSLFPSNVRERLLTGQGKDEVAKPKEAHTLTNFLESSIGGADHIFDTHPIADFFPNATVLFADIVGFTAWSSSREPTQVFRLLEAVYQIARKLEIYKVETVGDCYVAVSGLPAARKDHAVAMCGFARECMLKMRSITNQLEVTLGPDTGDLTMRMGIHSGPVTAGVLRGERPRFQLFGDTVNTAARMESTGQKDMIQISRETAHLLKEGGKSSCYKPRESETLVKGKGMLQTYWLLVAKTDSDHRTNRTLVSYEHLRPHKESTVPVPSGESGPDTTNRMSRLIDWNVEILKQLLLDITARRKLTPRSSAKTFSSDAPRKISSVLEEVQEIIELPHFEEEISVTKPSHCLKPRVWSQLRSYVTAIASMYRNENPFHNFEHASHVTMSVVKLLKRIVAPTRISQSTDCSQEPDASTLHDHTYGITSDSLTQFACVFSALIHDVEHPGVPNLQLVKEKDIMATMYNGKSVAEQNSVDVAWNLLMTEAFTDLRQTIFASTTEEKRFRQLVVNSVIATDIMDKDLKALRNARWEKAFQMDGDEENARDAINRKATIVIEHLIQASDVVHTMQHWQVYRRWNERLFEEMRLAYLAGRSDSDPADNWYIGELGFFDFYVIPLAKKLKECGVFGVSSDEYLNYAKENRAEWESKGREVVAFMKDKESSPSSL